MEVKGDIYGGLVFGQKVELSSTLTCKRLNTYYIQGWSWRSTHVPWLMSFIGGLW